MSQASISVGYTSISGSRTTDSEAIQRFRDVKDAIRERHGADLEITNEMVLSTLCDLYWLHDEREGWT